MTRLLFLISLNLLLHKISAQYQFIKPDSSGQFYRNHRPLPEQPHPDEYHGDQMAVESREQEKVVFRLPASKETTAGSSKSLLKRRRIEIRPPAAAASKNKTTFPPQLPKFPNFPQIQEPNDNLNISAAAAKSNSRLHFTSSGQSSHCQTRH